MFNLRYATAAAALAGLGITVAIACGPEFPLQLLDNREETLRKTPSNSFAYEATHLVSVDPNDKLKPFEAPHGVRYDRDGEEEDVNAEYVRQRELVEDADLDVDATAALRAMRQAETGDEAEALGAIVPPAIRLYAAGAVDFINGDPVRAAERFEEVLRLPESERAARAVWAAFMLGRIYAATNERDKAAQGFEMARKLALEDLPDPLGLAIASYGEEARMHLRRAKMLSGDGKAPSPPDAAPEYGAEIAAAVRLYAEQAAHGSQSGVESLSIVADQVSGNLWALDAAIGDPLVQRLLTAYEVAGAGAPNSRLGLIIEVVRQHGIDRPEGADRLAALAYSAGDFAGAAVMADKASGPLASWVKAKLALQRGDRAAAAAFYAEASRSFRTPAEAPLALSFPNFRLLEGERGVLALAQGEYVNALELLCDEGGTYWGDMVHIAERVLTTDELKSFIDRHVPSVPVNAPPRETEDSSRDNEVWARQTTPASELLRDLLARRLVREGRYEEAMPYFRAAVYRPTNSPDIPAVVSHYARALREADTSWWRTDRARAAFQAAVLARKFGMEMMGYEGGPDYFVWNGGYDDGLGQRTVESGPFVTEEERRRFDATAPKLDRRFHYRYVAVDHALRAADLLPARSQAYAAVLCHAAHWMMISYQFDRAWALYMRYVKEGAYVRWATHFGGRCPEPDFDAAPRAQRAYYASEVRRHVRPYRWPLAVISLGIAVGGAAWLIQRFRRGARPA